MSEADATYNTPGKNGLFADEMQMPVMDRLVLLANRQELPADREKVTKAGKLAVIGWRILPIPQLIEAGALCRDKNGKPFHPAALNFRRPAGYLVQPPDDNPNIATKFSSYRAAVAWATAAASEDNAQARESR